MARTPKNRRPNLPAKAPGNSNSQTKAKAVRATGTSQLGISGLTDPGLASARSFSNRIIAELPRNGLGQLSPYLQPLWLHSRQVLFDVAAPLDSLYFPESGMIGMFAVVADGKAVVLAAIGPEGFVPVQAFLGAERAQLRVVALVEGDALKVNRHELQRILAITPQFAASLLRYSDRYLSAVATLGACHALHSVLRRVATWLLIARDRTDSNVVQLTHESLADLLGCRRASITESLFSLEEAGAIRGSRGQTVILDHRLLARRACECYESLTTTNG